VHEKRVRELFERAYLPALDTPQVRSSRFEMLARRAVCTPVGPDRDDLLIPVHEMLEGEAEGSPVIVEDFEDFVCDLLGAAKDSWGGKSVALFPDDVWRKIAIEGF